MPDFLQLFGRFHVLIVHFPIALLVTVGMVEALGIARRRTAPAPAAGACLLIGTLAAIASAATGWFHADFATFPDEPGILFYHRWLGISSAAFSVIVLILYLVAGRSPARTPSLRIYQISTLLLALLVGITGHFGGSLTHGPDFLFNVSGASENKQPIGTAFRGTRSFQFAQVEPILQQACYNCHGPERQRGSLRVDSLEAINVGGTSGPAIIPGDSEHSLLIRRCLGLDGRPRMPFKKPPLPEDQIKQLRAWVDALPPQAAASSQPQ